MESNGAETSRIRREIDSLKSSKIEIERPEAAKEEEKMMGVKIGSVLSLIDRMERLKDGLGVVLGEFYQLAGKLGKDEDGVLRVEYDDEMKGVEVAAATAEQIEIGDLVAEESASKLKDLVPYNGIANVEGLHRPLLAIQTSSPSPSLRVKIFKFSESDIKITANSNPNPKPFSTFQSLSAHVWRAVRRAHNLEPGDATVFYVFANCRHRVYPPMPKYYFGNLIQRVVTKTSAALLLENLEEFSAGMIKKAIEMHGAKAIEAWNIEGESKVLGWKDAEENCVVTEVVRSGSNNGFDGTVYMHQGQSGGRSVDLDISLEANAMENLEKDEEFLMGMA
ncbi:hypothetical protein RHSIM_RhsimUnG0027800 [Rhododendron simsii]|uniref:Uncharacterized protein n=1 Tax=Rhododendron simsii TaxID=118357 RepID=A0A834FZT6_RHOSS|nr:hypothetical protein RHSIM_RhsimUnG0027800 [Rhododendron simsii]